MAGATNEPDLFPDEGAPAGVAIVNERCVLRTQDGHRVVLVCGIILAQHSVGALIQSALNGPATIEVTDKELLVTLAPLGSAHRTRAIAALCAEMDRRAATFPGTRLRLRYAVEGAP